MGVNYHGKKFYNIGPWQAFPVWYNVGEEGSKSEMLPWASPGSTKANRREPKTCCGRVFNCKLGCFNNVHAFIYVDARPHL
jgi:hypothetical protein